MIPDEFYVPSAFSTVKTEPKSPLNEHQLMHGEDHSYSFDNYNKALSQNNVKNYKSIHTGERPYDCDVCNKSCSRKDNLKVHQRLHSGEHRYCCDMCNKPFIQRSHLKTHQCIHSGECPNDCDMCNKSFIKKEDLKLHQCIHSGERPNDRIFWLSIHHELLFFNGFFQVPKHFLVI
ncbi:hypothetical protein L798_06326 [Zootermopsis nevadensis]|uniref:C2H2-type domain-containing protein n=1 Tax=Zootermopsis nevadensis TaxID=136037 RepID=A0A067RFW2_ZOONE|nr:hypothetical protein L798_06326 [Zootermopsis nevadensis]